MRGGQEAIRLLVAFEDDYRSYRGAISSAIQTLRPLMEVETAGTDAMEAELARLDPQVVICSRSEAAANPNGGVAAWVQLPMEPDSVGLVRVGDRHYDLKNPALEQLLEVIDAAEHLLQADVEPRRSHAP